MGTKDIDLNRSQKCIRWWVGYGYRPYPLLFSLPFLFFLYNVKNAIRIQTPIWKWPTLLLVHIHKHIICIIPNTSKLVINIINIINSLSLSLTMIKKDANCESMESSSSSSSLSRSSINDDSSSSLTISADNLRDDASSSSSSSASSHHSSAPCGPLYELADLMSQLPIK